MISAEESIPSHSDSGLAARDIFLEHYSDVNFYVEDTGQENLYLEILRRLFPDKRIIHIFPLRGKQNVIAHAQDPVNATRQERSVYILDKDFDDLLQHLIVKENIFYLDWFCIENYCFAENAIVEVAVECHPRINKEELRSRIAFNDFYKQTLQTLDPLFRLFFAVQRFNLGLRNCDLKPEQFTDDTPAELAPARVEEYKGQVLERVRAIGVFSSDQEFMDFLETAFPPHGELECVVSGKFILGLCHHHMRRAANVVNVSHDSLRYRLIKNNDLHELKPLATRISAFLDRTSSPP